MGSTVNPAICATASWQAYHEGKQVQSIKGLHVVECSVVAELCTQSGLSRFARQRFAAILGAYGGCLGGLSCLDVLDILCSVYLTMADSLPRASHAGPWRYTLSANPLQDCEQSEVQDCPQSEVADC